MDGHVVKVKVLLRAGDKLSTAIVFDIWTLHHFRVEHLPKLLHFVRDQLNRDDPQASFAKEYRAERNRSLSVGDVIVVGEEAWAVEQDGGWSAVTVHAEQIWPPRQVRRTGEGHEITIAIGD
jgi:hypothetical protein